MSTVIDENTAPLTEEELAELEKATHEYEIGHDSEDVHMADVQATPTRVNVATVVAPVTVTKPSLKVPMALARQVALAMVDGVESDVDDDVLAFVQTLSLPQVNDWLVRLKGKQVVTPPVPAADSASLAESIRKQSMANALGRPQFFTGKGEWSHWLASFLPWLSLQATQSDQEMIGIALSFVKGEALTHFKNSGPGNAYYGALHHGDDVLVTWEEFSECMAACPTDWYYTPQSIRAELDRLKAGPNFRVWQAKVDGLLARAGDMDQQTRIYFYLKALPAKYFELFKVDAPQNKEWQTYADLKAALCKRVQMEGWDVGVKTQSQSPPIKSQGHLSSPAYVHRQGQAQSGAVNPYKPGGGNSTNRYASAGGRGGHGLSAGYGTQPARAVNAARGGPMRGPVRGRGVGSGRGAGRFNPYRQNTTHHSQGVGDVPKKFNKPAIVNAVLSGTLTSKANLPDNVEVDQALSGRLRAPLPLMDFVGTPITSDTRSMDFFNGACFYCHHVGHTHDTCSEWIETMTKDGFFPIE